MCIQVVASSSSAFLFLSFRLLPAVVRADHALELRSAIAAELQFRIRGHFRPASAAETSAGHVLAANAAVFARSAAFVAMRATCRPGLRHVYVANPVDIAGCRANLLFGRLSLARSYFISQVRCAGKTEPAARVPACLQAYPGRATSTLGKMWLGLFNGGSEGILPGFALIKVVQQRAGVTKTVSFADDMTGCPCESAGNAYWIGAECAQINRAAGAIEKGAVSRITVAIKLELKAGCARAVGVMACK